MGGSRKWRWWPLLSQSVITSARVKTLSISSPGVSTVPVSTPSVSKSGTFNSAGWWS